MSRQFVSACCAFAAFLLPTNVGLTQTTVSPVGTVIRTPDIVESAGPGIAIRTGFGEPGSVVRAPYGGSLVGTYSVPRVQGLEASKDLPVEAQALVTEYTRESGAIQKRANCEIGKLRVSLRQRLKDLQDKYTRESKLDEAVAIRDQIRALQIPPDVLITDPISLWDGTNRVGQVFFFRVVGSTDGSVWGSDIYTSDSTIASVAVHAGVLKPGQAGIVKVTVLPGQSAYQGSTRNGVTGRAYGSYPASIKVEAPFDDTDCDGMTESAATKPNSSTSEAQRPRRSNKATRQNRRKKTP